MDLYEVFKHPFKLTGRITGNNTLHKSEYYRFKTEEIEAETTKEEIYVITKMYFDNFVEKFKNYQIDGENIMESSYYLYVQIEDEEKHIYSMGYNNILNKISIENKYSEDFPIEGKFKICLNISCYIFYEEEYDAYENTNIKTPIKEDECVVCYENKPNILFTDCLHICVCLECDKTGNFNKCPICRKKLLKEKILFNFL